MKIQGPAGGREAFDAALAAGADEIYLGLAGYGARRFAANFSPDEFCRALDDAHRLGVTLHLTLNTVMSDAEFDAVEPDLRRLYAAGLDAVIVQDFGVAARIRTLFPDLSIHASTQMALGNADEVAWAEKNGFSRVVLPRELSFAEIEAIRQASSVELEVFASGALCLACSGKCYLSSFVGGRSGNRGSCAQPCRQKYDIIFPANLPPTDLSAAPPRSGYLLSLADQLQGPETLARLIDAGVGVIKIEGRMKSPAYVYEAVRFYRRMLDRLTGVPKELSRKIFALKNAPPSEEENGNESDTAPRLPKLFHRGYGPGYFEEHDPPILHPDYASDLGAEIGQIENGAIRLSESVVFGDGIVYLDERRQKLSGGNVNRIIRLPQGSGTWREEVREAASGDAVLFEFPPPEGARSVHRTFDHRLQKEIAHAIENVRRHRPIAASLRAKIGQPLELTLELALGRTPGEKGERAPGKERERFFVTEVSDVPLERSLKRKTDPEELAAALDRFGETPFALEQCAIDADPEVFIPKSLLNQLRQKAAERLERELRERSYRETPEAAPKPTLKPTLKSPLKSPLEPTSEIPPSEESFGGISFGGISFGGAILSAVVRTAAQALCCRKLGIGKIYPLTRSVLFEGDRTDRCAALERLFGPDAEPLTGGISYAPLAGTLAEALWFESRRIPFAAESCFNVGNRYAAEFLLDRFSQLRTLYLSTELSEKSILRLAGELAPVLRQRGGNVALSVFGHPAGMLTRKTLFDAERAELLSQDNRSFVVVRNRDWYADGGNLTGSTVYYAPENDSLFALKRLAAGGIGEFRFDFTLETPEEIEKVLHRVESLPSNDRTGPAYGFDHPIF